MAQTINVEGIVLSVQEYKEKDALVKILTESEIIQFRARGVQKVNSKNRTLCQPFSRVNLDLMKNNSFYSLIQGSCIEYYYFIQEDLVLQSIFFVLRDILIMTKISPDLYRSFMSALRAFQIGLANAYSWACLCVKEIIEKQGIAPYVRGCVQCHTLNGLETISIENGGFLCSKCNHGQHNKYKKEEMVEFYSLFKVSFNDFDRFVDMYLMSAEQFLFLCHWFEYHMHVQLKSVQFLKSVLMMK